MKTKLLLFAVLTAFFQFTNAQCSRSGTFVTGSITFTTAGTKEIVFESDFATVQGADLRVYLSSTDDIATPGSNNIQVSSQLINDDGGTGGAGVSPITGVRTFTLPSNIELNDYNFIVIQCIIINERWGHAPLGALTGVDCATLSIDENSLLQNVNFSPNPTKDNIEITNDRQLDLNITILDLLGKEVLSVENKSIRKQNINLSSLKTGVYLVQIQANGNAVTKKLIKQ